MLFFEQVPALDRDFDRPSQHELAALDRLALRIEMEQLVLDADKLPLDRWQDRKVAHG